MISLKRLVLVNLSLKEKHVSSKIYQKVLAHRAKCGKWGKRFCLECFGFGLTNYISSLELELKNEK